jgi:hypothetical protein
LLKANSEIVSFEQLCVWRETERWVDHAEAILIGFSNSTVEDVLSRHTAEHIHLEGQIDGSPTETLPPRILRSYGYEIIWEQLAGSYLAGSRGTCALRLFSYDRVRGDALYNLDRSANGGTASPDGTIVSGYHRLITDICLRRRDAIQAWSANDASARNAPAKEKVGLRVVDELLCLHLGGPIKNFLAEYVDLIGSTNSDLTNEAIEAALQKECPRLRVELITRSPQRQTFGRTSYILKVGKKISVQWSPIVEGLLLRMRHDSPTLESWAGLYRAIREIVGSGKSPTDRAIKDHFKKNYPQFFKKIRAASRTA